jgi:Bacterial membrane protein YfhO
VLKVITFKQIYLPFYKTKPMQNFSIKSIVPYLAAVAIFITLTLGYFTPLLKGKVIIQSDMVQNKGMSKEIVDHREQYHEEPLWTNSMFGGMPSYQIAITYPGNLMKYIRSAFWLWMQTPANMVFSYMLGFYILLLVLGVDKWLSIVGSIGFGFSAFFFLIIDAGHNTQALAIGYMAPVFAGVILVSRGKYLIGGALTALFMALELLNNHPQIAYYLVLFLAIYVAFDWFQKIKEKNYAHLYKSTAVFAIAAVLALGCNINSLWNTYEYSKFTIRGPSELTANKTNQTTGLDKDYATQWSMGVSETMTLMIPGFKGKSSSMRIGEEKSALKNVDSQMKELVASMPQYWGDQPFTTSPYSGAIVIFLFVFGLFVVQGRMKWTLLFITIFSMALAWGKNMMWLTDLFLDYFPGYNKFRAVSMILVLAELAIPILAVLALDKLLKTPDLFSQKINLPLIKKEINAQAAFITSLALTAGVSLLLYLVPNLVSFESVSDYQIMDYYTKSNGADIAQQIMDNIETARKALFKADALRSFMFIAAAGILVWLFAKKKMQKGIFIAALAILVLVDLAWVDKYYLNDKNFTSAKEAQNPFAASKATLAILEDKDPNYRVLNMDLGKDGPFNDASTSYYHKSIGGYHAAKLRRYQELIEGPISEEMGAISQTLSTNPSDSALRACFAQQQVLDMLNMRYLIYSRDANPLSNRYAFGNAWFVNDIKWVKNADEEIAALRNTNLRSTAIIDERFKESAGNATSGSADDKIELTEYRANLLKYQYNSSNARVAVFSEIYYADGWNAYIDGQLQPHYRANYVLRAMTLPAGNHQVEFKFEPTRYYTGEKISLASCLLLFGFVGVSLFLGLKKKQSAD